MSDPEDSDEDSGLKVVPQEPDTPAAREEVNLEELPEEEREEILKRARSYVQTQNIKKAQQKSTEKRKRKGGGLHKRGSHWYELEAYFDPKLIESTPIEDSGFMMGVLEDFVVVEVKEDTAVATIQQIGAQLAEMGIKSLVVRAGIRFLRLNGCDPEKEKQLDEILKKQAEGANGKGGEDTDEKPPGDDAGD
jgi:hypothetical protein